MNFENTKLDPPLDRDNFIPKGLIEQSILKLRFIPPPPLPPWLYDQLTGNSERNDEAEREGD